MVSHIAHHIRAFRRPPAASALVALLCLSGIIWLSVAPAFMVTSCGLLEPHSHLLLGGASELDLETHLAAEAACAHGDPLAAALLVTQLRPGKPEVLSMPHVEDRSTQPASILSVDLLAVLAPSLLSWGSLLALIVWRLSALPPTKRLLYLPILDPPPEACPIPSR